MVEQGTEEFFLPARLVLNRRPKANSGQGVIAVQEYGAQELLSVTPLEYQCEESPGVVACGGMEVAVSLGSSWKEPQEIHLLDGFDPDKEKVVGELLWQWHGREVNGFTGIMDKYQHDVVGRKVMFTFTGGISIYKDVLTKGYRDEITGEPWVGRPLEFLLNGLCDLAGIIAKKRHITIPKLTSLEKFWSYGEHPERRWALSSTSNERNLQVTALAYGGGEVFVGVGRHVLAYNPGDYSWRFIATIPPRESLAFCTVAVLAMQYLTTPPQLRLFCANQPVPAFGGFAPYQDYIAWEVTLSL